MLASPSGKYVKAAANVAFWLSGFVTATLTAPVPAGAVARMVVGETKVTPVAAAVPKVTVAPFRKLVPVIVTVVPPLAVPWAGLTPLTVGAGLLYVKAFVFVAEPVAVVTTTLTSPAAWAGVTAVILVGLVTDRPVAAVPPTVTLETFTKLVPVMVIVVPPEINPEAGATVETVGAGVVYVNELLRVTGDVILGNCTTTDTKPAAWAGVTAVICVEDTNVTLVAGVPPIVTLVGATRLAPVSVIVVPPVVRPVDGETLVSVGLGAI